MLTIQDNAVQNENFATITEEMCFQKSFRPPLNDHVFTIYSVLDVEVSRHRPTGKITLKGKMDARKLALILDDIIPSLSELAGKRRKFL